MAKLDDIEQIAKAPTTLLSLADAKPLKALEMLKQNMPVEVENRLKWRDAARVAAVMGSGPRSLASFKSGIRHWMSFIEILYGSECVEKAAFPPALKDILAWSNTFRYHTFI